MQESTLENIRERTVGNETRSHQQHGPDQEQYMEKKSQENITEGTGENETYHHHE